MERSEATRRRLIDAAVTCLSEHGCAESTIEAVASRAGVSRGAVQHHFGSRNDLLIAVVGDFGLALARTDRVSRTLPVARRVSDVIDRTWDLVRSPHFVAVVQIWLATRHDREVVRVTGRKIALLESELDRQWLDLFSDIRVPAERSAVIRHLVLATLRGLALRTLYRKERASWVKEIAALKSMVTAALA
jgi:AcrR family transcriptional regulator